MIRNNLSCNKNIYDNLKRKFENDKRYNDEDDLPNIDELKYIYC